MRVLSRLTEAAVRRPWLALAVVAGLAVAGGLLATRLRPSAATDTFVSASSPAYRATVRDERAFGDDAIVVLVRAPVTRLLAPAALSRLTALEACLDGESVRYDAALRAEVPAPGNPSGSGPCGELARHRPALVVYGPGTFLNRAVAAVNASVESALRGARTSATRVAATAYHLALARGASRAQALADADAARQAEEVQTLESLERTAAGVDLTGVPSVRDATFLRGLVFGAGTTGEASPTPQPRLAYLFPRSNAAIIQVRLRASLSASAQTRAIRWIREAVASPRFAPPSGGSTLVSGVPVLLSDLSGQISGAIGALFAAAVALMALALLVVFRGPLRLLPLLVALSASGITFGLLSLAGVPLTLASVAVLPVLVGLGVDYGVQFQSRVAEAGGAGSRAGEAIARATRHSAPALATAAAATAVGFLVLLLSPVPMVRGFGLLLVAGIAVGLLCTLVAVPAALVLHARGGGAPGAALRGAGDLLAGPAGALGAALRGAGELCGLAAGPARAAVRGLRDGLGLPCDLPALLRGLTRRPGRVLVLGLVLAAAGWAADGATPVQSDVTRLVPQSTPSMRALRALQATTGVSGEIDVLVRGRDVATPATLRWMSGYQSALLHRFGYGASGSCARATLCPALSLTDLFGTDSAALTRGRIDTLLSTVPRYFSSAVLTPDRRAATLAFGIRLMPLARQQQVIAQMRARLHPPPGVSATLTGLPVLAAQAESALAAPGRRLAEEAVGLLAVALVLRLLLRDLRRALVPMAPIVLATGWSSLVLFLVGIPLNPMSATLGALVIAISTEFSVLLCERHRQEREAGVPPGLALARTYRSTGRAVLVSAITAIVGFGVLVISDITMLRDFGLVTLVDLSVSLAGVLLVLPAALTWRPRASRRPVVSAATSG